MKRLYVYACSYGKFGHVCQPPSALGAPVSSNPKPCPICSQYPDIANESWVDNRSFPQLMANDLGLDLVNRSFPGASNYKLFTFFLDDLPQMDFGDMVFFQWTHINRAWYAKDPRRSVMVHNHPEFEGIANFYYEHFYDDRQSLSQLIGLSMYVKHRTPGKYYFGTADPYDTFNNIDSLLCADLYNMEECINPKKANVIMDILNQYNTTKFHCGHPNEYGHQRVAEEYLKNIRELK